MSEIKERIVIERKGSGLGWEIVARPKNNAADTMVALAYLEVQERKKQHPAKLRVVKEMREILFERDCSNKPSGAELAR